MGVFTSLRRADMTRFGTLVREEGGGKGRVRCSGADGGRISGRREEGGERGGWRLLYFSR